MQVGEIRKEDLEMSQTRMDGQADNPQAVLRHRVGGWWRVRDVGEELLKGQRQVLNPTGVTSSHKEGQSGVIQAKGTRG